MNTLELSQQPSLVELLQNDHYIKDIILSANEDITESAAESLVQKRRGELLKERELIRRKFSDHNEQEGTLETKYTIEAYIDILKKTKIEFDNYLDKDGKPNFENLITNTEFIDSANTIVSKWSDYLADYFKYIGYDPSNEMFWIGGVIAHDFNHISNDVMQPLSYMYYGVTEVDGVNYVEGFYEKFDNLINFLEVLQKFVGFDARVDNKQIALKDVFKTIYMPEISINIDPNFTINSFTEFISLRTLIINSIKIGTTEIIVKAKRDENKDGHFQIFDNATDGVWPEVYKQHMQSAYEYGAAHERIPGVRTARGGVITSQILGQKSSRLGYKNPLYAFSDGDKLKSITFTVPHENFEPPVWAKSA